MYFFPNLTCLYTLYSSHNTLRPKKLGGKASPTFSTVT